jgi:hypothetical protein
MVCDDGDSSEWMGDGDIAGETEERTGGKEHHISPRSADTPSGRTVSLLSDLEFLLIHVSCRMSRSPRALPLTSSGARPVLLSANISRHRGLVRRPGARDAD